MKKNRVALARGQVIDLASPPRKPLKEFDQSPQLLSFAAANSLSGDAELVMLPFLPPSPVANTKYEYIVYDQAALCESFNKKGKWKPVDLGHVLLTDAAAPAQGWGIALGPNPKNPAHTGACAC